MPLPVTQYFEQRLAALRTLSLEAATLAEDIAAALRPEALKKSADEQSQWLFDRMYEVARQEVACAMHLAGWLYVYVHFKVLTLADLDAFIGRAVVLGGPKAVVDHDLS
uniref:Uncharacterized protein n=1 Tax=Pseudomonas fluorescens (strain SBW25) TaxID=216595 RepID=A0A0G4E6A2_PSEFS|nr:hypothetical protein [Pseudomonas fluorescens]CEK42543.1 hypothetical protein PQBR55_0164 [Pseudomonas fluorescens SBW25]